MDYLDPSLPVLIRTARSVLNWSQQGLADRAGVAFNTIGRLERCETTGRAKTVKAIVDCFEQAGLTLKVDGSSFGLSVRNPLATQLRQRVRKIQMSDSGSLPTLSENTTPQTRVRRHKIIVENAEPPQVAEPPRKKKSRIQLGDE